MAGIRTWLTGLDDDVYSLRFMGRMHARNRCRFLSETTLLYVKKNYAYDRRTRFQTNFPLQRFPAQVVGEGKKENLELVGIPNRVLRKRGYGDARKEARQLSLNLQLARDVESHAPFPPNAFPARRPAFPARSPPFPARRPAFPARRPPFPT